MHQVLQLQQRQVPDFLRDVAQVGEGLGVGGEGIPGAHERPPLDRATRVPGGCGSLGRAGLAPTVVLVVVWVRAAAARRPSVLGGSGTDGSGPSMR
ncbi:hypothetical protein GCM10022420_070740 [Streptomyces iranensis]